MIRSLAKWCLLVIAAISVLAIISSAQIGFDYDFEKFFPLGDEDLDFFLDHRKRFETDNDFLLIGFHNAAGVFEPGFLSRIDSLTVALNALPQVDQVISPTNSYRLIKGPFNWVPVPYLHPAEPERLQQDRSYIYDQTDLVGRMFSTDGRSVCLVVKHRQQIKKAAADSLMTSLSAQIDSLGLPPARLAGKIRAQPVFLDLIQREMTMFLAASLLLVILFLAITYRALWAVLIPLLVVALAAAWTLGFMNLVGKPLDMMMVLLPTIIFVVGMSDVVHILTRYIEELRHGHSRINALKTTFREVGIATFLTSLTTGIGFLTLITSNITPIRDLGIYTACGVLIAYILAFSLLPSALVYLPTPKIAANSLARRRWRHAMCVGLIRTLKNRTKVLFGTFIMVCLALLGMRNLQVNTFLIDDLPRSHPLKSDFLFFDENFGGSRPFEMAINVKTDQHDVFDHDILDEIDKVHQYLADPYQATALTSPVSIVKSINQAFNGGSRNHYVLPDSNELRKLQPHLNRILKRPDLHYMVSEDMRSSRITGRMADIGSNITTAKTSRLRNYINSSVDTSLVEFRVTGTSLLIDKNNGYLVKNMGIGLAIAFGVVAFIAGLMFRSWRMILITLVVNIIPLMMVAGIMGVFGITLKLTTSVIFTVAFGIAVDDTIHFISKLKMELAQGKSTLYAIKRTYFSTGKAIVITTLILISGFMTLLLSSFGGTFYIGLFVGLTLLFALGIDLTLLPVLILLFYRKPR